MELLDIILYSCLLTLIVIHLCNVYTPKQQVILFLALFCLIIVGNLVKNKCLNKEKFVINSERLNIEKMLFDNRYRNNKFKSKPSDFIKDIKNYKDLHNPTTQTVYDTKVLKLF